MHSGRTSAAVTKAWQDYAREKGKGRAKSSIAFSFRRKQVLLDAIAVWKAYQAKKERAGAAALKALVHLKQNLAQKSMDSWKPWHEKQMSKKKGREEALNIYKSVSKSIILHALICSTIYEIPDSRNTNKCLVNITSNWSVSETIFLFSQIPATEMGVWADLGSGTHASSIASSKQNEKAIHVLRLSVHEGSTVCEKVVVSVPKA